MSLKLFVEPPPYWLVAEVKRWVCGTTHSVCLHISKTQSRVPLFSLGILNVETKLQLFSDIILRHSNMKYNAESV